MVILSRSQMMRATPEMAHRLQAFAPHKPEGVWPMTADLTCTKPTYDLQWNQ
ncbi:hypothetical protein AVEN_135995-1, partial [Araneus ventricosus]